MGSCAADPCCRSRPAASSASEASAPWEPSLLSAGWAAIDSCLCCMGEGQGGGNAIATGCAARMAAAAAAAAACAAAACAAAAA